MIPTDFSPPCWRSAIARIRPAKEGDVQAIADVYVETWRSTYAGILPDKVLIEMSPERQMVMWARAIRHADGPAEEKILVLEDDQAKVIGVGSAGFNRDRTSTYDGEVYTLYVHPDHQNQGHGEHLLAGLFDLMVAQGYNAAVIWVLSLNPSRFFYEVMGGKRVGEREEKLWGAILSENAYGWEDLEAALDSGRPRLG
jgi:L-amino acid N-acyltransferase YncA|tara:strand:- start:5338 stop:5931 length:594 start_codon:yes stop_codon:yes gene_type:complete